MEVEDGEAQGNIATDSFTDLGCSGVVCVEEGEYPLLTVDLVVEPFDDRLSMLVSYRL